MASLVYRTVSPNAGSAWDTANAATTISYKLDWATDSLRYVDGASPRAMYDIGRKESAEEWLERRVNEVRVKL